MLKKDIKELVDGNVKALVEKGLTKERALTVLLYKFAGAFVNLHEENSELKEVK